MFSVAPASAIPSETELLLVLVAELSRLIVPAWAITAEPTTEPTVSKSKDNFNDDLLRM
jgi:hypothetical protein